MNDYKIEQQQKLYTESLQEKLESLEKSQNEIIMTSKKTINVF